MPEFAFIINPEAGKGAGRRVAPPLEQGVRDLRLDHVLLFTEGRGHATSLARDADARIIVAVGGDGTINEVANGITGSEKALGIVPTGSGNDFIKSVGVPRNMQKALEIVRHKTLKSVDIGRVSCGRFADGAMVYEPDRLFINGVGVGFDAAVARRVSEIRVLRGTLLYLVAVFQTLGRFRMPVFHGSTESEEWTAPHLLVASGNGRCAGGGFYLTPEAEVDDGVLDVCAIREVTVARILRLIPAVMRGKPVRDPNVRYMKTTRLQLESESLFDVHADGEIVGRGVHGVRLSIMPSAIRVVVPGSGVAP